MDFGPRPAHSDEWMMVKSNLERMIGFSGICMVDEANPAVANPGTAVALNTSNAGQPDAGEQWLLVKARVPWATTATGQEAHLPALIELNYTGGGDAGATFKMWWRYNLITADFQVSGASCATWNTKPATVTGSDGIIDCQGFSPNTVTCDSREASIVEPGWANAVTAYGIALIPYDFFGCGTGATMQHTVDYTKWFIRT
jgi:hypothetical protein